MQVNDPTSTAWFFVPLSSPFTFVDVVVTDMIDRPKGIVDVSRKHALSRILYVRTERGGGGSR